MNLNEDRLKNVAGLNLILMCILLRLFCETEKYNIKAWFSYERNSHKFQVKWIYHFGRLFTDL